MCIPVHTHARLLHRPPGYNSDSLAAMAAASIETARHPAHTLPSGDSLPNKDVRAQAAHRQASIDPGDRSFPCPCRLDHAVNGLSTQHAPTCTCRRTCKHAVHAVHANMLYLLGTT